MRRPIRITSRKSPEVQGNSPRGLGGIYNNDIAEYRAEQTAGNTRVPLATEPAYTPDSHRKPNTPIADADLPREIRMTAMHRESGESPIHYQRDWLLLNPQGVTHDLIHLAVQNIVRENAGFISEMVSAIQHSAGSESNTDEPKDWSIGSKIEECIVDALERAGIRENKVTERFWEYLEEEASGYNLPDGLIDTFVTPERIGRICDEINILSTQFGDGATHTVFVP